MFSTSTIISVPISDLTAIRFALQGIASSLQSPPFWDTQWFGTIIGAIIGLLPSFYLLYKDRPIIKVTMGHALVSTGMRVQSGLWLKVANFGRRPLMITSAFLEFSDGTTLIFTNDNLFYGGSGLPKMLEGGSAHSVTILAGNIANEIIKGEYPSAGCFRDALGSVYKASISQEFWDNFFKVAASGKYDSAADDLR